MSDLTEFLLARFAEDKASAKIWGRTGRELLDCAAKRRIVEELVLPYIAERRRLMNGQPSWSDEHPTLLLFLALPYADHPDYREEWKP